MTEKNTYGTTISSKLIGRRTDREDNWDHFEWLVTLEREGKKREVPFKMGVGNQQTKCGIRMPMMSRYNPAIPCQHTRCHNAGWQPSPPTLYDVLCSLKADATNGASFAEWAGDFGYDTDSIKAREMYFACQQSEDESRKFFGADWPKIVEDEEYT